MSQPTPQTALSDADGNARMVDLGKKFLMEEAEIRWRYRSAGHVLPQHVVFVTVAPFFRVELAREPFADLESNVDVDSDDETAIAENVEQQRRGLEELCALIDRFGEEEARVREEFRLAGIHVNQRGMARMTLDGHLISVDDQALHGDMDRILRQRMDAMQDIIRTYSRPAKHGVVLACALKSLANAFVNFPPLPTVDALKALEQALRDLFVQLRGLGINLLGDHAQDSTYVVLQDLFYISIGILSDHRGAAERHLIACEFLQDLVVWISATLSTFSPRHSELHMQLSVRAHSLYYAEGSSTPSPMDQPLAYFGTVLQLMSGEWYVARGLVADQASLDGIDRLRNEREAATAPETQSPKERRARKRALEQREAARKGATKVVGAFLSNQGGEVFAKLLSVLDPVTYTSEPTLASQIASQLRALSFHLTSAVRRLNRMSPKKRQSVSVISLPSPVSPLTPRSKDPFAILPEEILRQIFDYLPGSKCGAYRSASAVSKGFRHFARRLLYRDVVIRSSRGLNAFIAAVGGSSELGADVEGLDIRLSPSLGQASDGTSNSELQAAFANLPNLRRLSLCDPRLSILVLSPTFLPTHFPLLTHLTFDDAVDERTATAVIMVPPLATVWYTPRARKIKAKQSVDLTLRGDLANIGFATIPSRFERIEAFRCVAVTDNAHDACFVPTLNSLPASVQNISLRVVPRKLVSDFPELLRRQAARQARNDIGPPLERFNSLTSLSLDVHVELLSTTLWDLLRHARTLSYLSFDHQASAHLTIQQLKSLIDGPDALPSLSALDVSIDALDFQREDDPPRDGMADSRPRRVFGCLRGPAPGPRTTGWRVPKWRSSEFNRQGTGELIEFAAARGVTLGGSLVRAYEMHNEFDAARAARVARREAEGLLVGGSD